MQVGWREFHLLLVEHTITIGDEGPARWVGREAAHEPATSSGDEAPSRARRGKGHQWRRRRDLEKREGSEASRWGGRAAQQRGERDAAACEAEGTGSGCGGARSCRERLARGLRAGAAGSLFLSMFFFFHIRNTNCEASDFG